MHQKKSHTVKSMLHSHSKVVNDNIILHINKHENINYKLLNSEVYILGESTSLGSFRLIYVQNWHHQTLWVADVEVG